MPTYVIEREMPGVGELPAAELVNVSQKSCNVLNEMGPQIQWVESFVTPNKLYCVYRAPNEDTIRDHASRGGFPANQVCEVKARIDPCTAEGWAN